MERSKRIFWKTCANKRNLRRFENKSSSFRQRKKSAKKKMIEGIFDTLPFIPPEIFQRILLGMDTRSLLTCRRVNTFWKGHSDEILGKRALEYWQPDSFTPSAHNQKLSTFILGLTRVTEFCDTFCQDGTYKGFAIPTGSVHMEYHTYQTLHPNIWRLTQMFIASVGELLTCFTLDVNAHFYYFKQNCPALNSSKYLHTLFLQMPNLKALTIRGVIFMDERCLTDDWYKENLLPPMKELAYLDVKVGNRRWADYRVIDWLLRSYGGQLVTLRCHQDVIINHFQSGNNKPDKFERLLALKVTSTRSHNVNFKPGAYKEPEMVLKYCTSPRFPKLERLYVKCDYPEFIQSLVELENLCETITQLHFDVTYTDEDEPREHKWHDDFVDSRGKRWPSIKRRNRLRPDDLQPLFPSADMINSLIKKKKHYGVKILTLPWHQTSGFWRYGGIQKIMKIFPCLETLHLTQCNYWIKPSNRRSYDSLINENLAAEFTRDEHGLKLMATFKKLKCVAFFPDKITDDRYAFLKCVRRSSGQVQCNDVRQ